MTTIEIKTFIKAPIERCFDLSRSIDLHIESVKDTREIAIEGRKGGLIEKNEFVKWEATHFCTKLYLTVKITEFNRPDSFTDEMIKGNFKSMRHVHYFSGSAEGTIMKDIFIYEVPYGFIGKIFNMLILKNYLKKFLLKRNEVIKEAAQTEKWKYYLR